MELARMGEQDAERQEPRLAEYARFPESARVLLDAEASVPAAAVGPTEALEGGAELETVLDRVDAAEMAVYGSRLTTPDIEPLGFEAVRILAPTAQPLFTGRPYFGDRASRVPAELGFEPALDKEPHPFP
jgi:ribosomal protein S12 methylthiotransferase accessory factor